jgi:hypothetical protein
MERPNVPPCVALPVTAHLRCMRMVLCTGNPGKVFELSALLP